MGKDAYKYFRVEARELVEQLGQATLALEKGAAESAKGGDPALVQRLLRLAHTLKGAAGAVRLREIVDAAHAIEGALAPYREGDAPVPRAAIDAVLENIDAVAERVSALGPGDEAAPARPPEDPPPAAAGAQTIRADVIEVDALLGGIAEVQAYLTGLRKATGQLEHARRLGALLAQQLAPRPGREALAARSLAEDLRALLGALDRGLTTAARRMDQELAEVRDAAEHLRLIPVGPLVTALERTARDVARSLAKPVLFEGYGSEVRVDAHLLGDVQAALVQLIRNAVAHGIEGEAERMALGKPPAGRVRVEIARRGRSVVFSCRDDGRGIDVEAVRRAAVKKGITDPHNTEALIALLLKGGISTSATVTEASGRGVGLDVVRASMERLGGEVQVHTDLGRGVRVDLIVPLSLASIEAIAVEGGGLAAYVPLDAVVRVLRVAAGEVAKTAAGESVVVDGEVVRLVRLSKVLSREPVAARGERAFSALIVQTAGRRAALGVDRLVGAATVVVRPLPALAPVHAIVAGAAFDAEGTPRMVLDAEGVLAAADRGSLEAPVAKPSTDPILIIDDSLTTRMLEQSILESAGYAVELATSAEEALDKAQLKKFALFLVDVEMPGMDGFAFIERVHQDPALRGTPAVLVTSRGANEDRERARVVGAEGYIVKSDFDQAELLSRIKRLVG